MYISPFVGKGVCVHTTYHFLPLNILF